MRIINLDETGIKLITNAKRQMYISRDSLQQFIKGQYRVENNTLQFEGKTLELSAEEIDNFSNIIKYIKTEVLNLSK